MPIDEISGIRVLQNNPKIKSPGVKMNFTQEQLDEWIACSQDFFYFCENYAHILSLDGGLVLFKMRPYQKKLIKLIQHNRFVIGKIPRQYGKSIAVLTFFVWCLLFQDNFRIGILANDDDVAMKLLQDLQLIYEELPFWMQQGARVWNKHEIVLENNSTIIARATTPKSGRSRQFHIVLLDEFAWVERNIQDGFYSAVYPTLTSSEQTKMVILSTPHGMEKFCELWHAAKKKLNLFKLIEVSWRAIDGRDDKWKKDTIAQIGQLKFDQEFGCKFLGSQNTLIEKEALEVLINMQEPPLHEAGSVKVYEDPIEKHVYIMVLDPSEGQNQDVHAISVMDVTTLPYRQVATYRCNSIDPMQLPSVVESIARKYNEAWVLIELNSQGKQIANILYYEIEYLNVIMVSKDKKHGQRAKPCFGKNMQLGVITSVTVKAVGCSMLKSLVENKKVEFKDAQTISELCTFISKGHSFAAETSYTDDLAMTMVLFGWLTTQEYFKDLTDTNLRAKLVEESASTSPSSVYPFGIVDDGLSDRDNPEQFVEPDGTVWVSNDYNRAPDGDPDCFIF